jgi:CRISPR system Cascade subunit CasB
MTRIYPLIEQLEKLTVKPDRAALAKLRRGLGKSLGSAEMYPLIIPFLPKHDYHHSRYFLVAALFGLHPQSTAREESIGTIFSKMDASESVEKRFIALLNAHEDELDYHLRQAVSLARSREIPINYHRLLDDILHWTHEERYVQYNWAKDYWVTFQDETATAKISNATSIK